jgi:hypothetical protein
MQEESRTNVVRRYFAGITEHTFHADLGVTDTHLVDYLTDLLTRFIRSDAVYRVRDLTGRPLSEVAQMLLEAEERIGEAKREVHRHVGDFILFWAGCYPDALPKLKRPNTADSLIDYCSQAKRSYRIASKIPADPQTPAPSRVLEHISDEFELCVYGLGEVRRHWQSRDDSPDGPFLIG